MKKEEKDRNEPDPFVFYTVSRNKPGSELLKMYKKLNFVIEFFKPTKNPNFLGDK